MTTTSLGQEIEVPSSLKDNYGQGHRFMKGFVTPGDTLPCQGVGCGKRE